ncbi:MAG: hypothetical protein ACI91R_002357 [Vicingaceae bacterium]|jgi:hypothetical protein
MRNLYMLAAGAALVALQSCSTTRPYAATNNPIGSKVGTSETTLILGTSAGTNLEAGLVSTNKEFGVIQAARKGKINKVATVDVKTTNYVFFQKVEVIVTGE